MKRYNTGWWLGCLSVVVVLTAAIGAWWMRGGPSALRVTPYRSMAAAPATEAGPRGVTEPLTTARPPGSVGLDEGLGETSPVLDEMPLVAEDSQVWRPQVLEAADSTEIANRVVTEGGEAAEPMAVDATQDFDTLVVCPIAWHETLRPWLEYRSGQGRVIGLTDRPRDPSQLKDLLNELHPRGLKYLLLVGDVPQGLDWQGVGVPTQLVDSPVNQRLGERAHVASDHWYADLNGDQSPDLAVGRWSVRNAAQLSAIIEKTIRFETEPDPESLRRRIEFVAGVGGFGPVEDQVIEGTATRLLTDLVPGYFQVGMTHASWRSVYCPGPNQYQEKVFESLNRGALFWVYMGHGSWNSLDAARFPDRVITSITSENASQIEGRTSPIALLLACSTGQFDRRQACVAESMLRAPQGPVAVLAGSGVTAPYGLSALGFEMLTLYRQGQAEELGPWIQEAKRQMLSTHCHQDQALAIDSSPVHAVENGDLVAADDQHALMDALEFGWADYRRLLRQLAFLLSPTRDMLDQELVDHAHMMNLFGDPLLRLPRYSDIELHAVADQEGNLNVSGRLPPWGSEVQTVAVEVELVHPLDRLPFRPQVRRSYEASDDFSQQLAQDYQAANDRLIHRSVVEATAESFHLPLANLASLPSRIWIRASAEDGDQVAVGFYELHLRPASDPAAVVVEVPTEDWDSPPQSDAELSGLRTEITEQDPEPARQDQEKEKEQGQEKGEGGDHQRAAQSDPQAVELFDGESLAGWKVSEFGGPGEVEVANGQMLVEMGHPLTGVTFAGSPELPLKSLPRENYEIQVRAKKVEGSDFFCGLTFPVGEQSCSFIVGGWGGLTVGLSTIDGLDAARNPTRSVHRFEQDRWYDIRVRVTDQRIQCWIDDQQVVDQARQDHEFAIRPEVYRSLPLGLCSFQTVAAFEKIRLVFLETKE